MLDAGVQLMAIANHILHLHAWQEVATPFFDLLCESLPKEQFAKLFCRTVKEQTHRFLGPVPRGVWMILFKLLVCALTSANRMDLLLVVLVGPVIRIALPYCLPSHRSHISLPLCWEGAYVSSENSGLAP